MLLIITPSDFVGAVAPLKEHKDQTGIPTTIITLDDVYSNYLQGDEAERVKRCIAKMHKEQGIRFVLLMGDADVFPVRYTKTDRADANAFNIAFYPTDLYYAALYKEDRTFDNWDTNNNGYYGELNGETHTGEINVDAVRLVPVIAVGRVPASTPQEANRYVQKVIRYEKAQNPIWTESALLMATDDWFPDACEVQKRIADEILDRYKSIVLATPGSLCSESGTLNISAINDTFNQGVGLVTYIGHGNMGNLAIPGGWWGTANIAQLTNTNRLPVMCVAACNTAEFTTLPPYSGYVDINNVAHAGTIHGEIFTSPPPQPGCLQHWNNPDDDLATALTVRYEAGVVAYLGGVTGLQMYEPMEYFVQGMTKRATIGEAWQWMVQHYYDVQGLPGTLTSPNWFAVARVHQPWKYMLFGDPSLRISGPQKPWWWRGVRWFRPLSWAWIAIIGGALMITPGGITCIACGPEVSKVVGIVLILGGLGAIIRNRRALSVRD